MDGKAARRRWGREGMYTVEASIIIPLLLCIITLFIFLLSYMVSGHQNQSAAQRGARSLANSYADDRWDIRSRSYDEAEYRKGSYRYLSGDYLASGWVFAADLGDYAASRGLTDRFRKMCALMDGSLGGDKGVLLLGKQGFVASYVTCAHEADPVPLPGFVRGVLGGGIRLSAVSSASAYVSDPQELIRNLDLALEVIAKKMPALDALGRL